MDWAKLVVELLNSWPLIILVIIAYFRLELRQLLLRVVKLGKDGLEFEAQPKEVQRPLEELGRIEPTVHVPSLSDASGKLDDLPSLSTKVTAMVENHLLQSINVIAEQKRIPLAIRQLAEARVSTAFERIYSFIFGSQFDALAALIKSGGFTSVSEARLFYEGEVRSKFSSYYERSTFEEWSRYLFHNQLVEQDADKITITFIGRDFVEYVNIHQLPRKDW